VVEGVSRHHSAGLECAEHRPEQALLFLVFKTRPRQTAQNTISGRVPQALQMLIETFRGIIDDMGAGELPFQMVDKNLVDLDGEIKR